MACAQGTLQVLPGGYANVEGNSASGEIFRTTSSRLQQVYSATEFSVLAGRTGRIDGLSFRMDASTTQSFVGIWPGVTLALSTTARNPDNLSPVFEENAGADFTFVYGGSLTIIATYIPDEPRMFQIDIPFTTPFFYDPLRGNLSLQFVSSSGPTNLFLDGQSTFGDSVGRVTGPNATMGSVDTFGFITRFNITPIPEPSTLALAITFTFCLWLRKPRLSRNRGS
jgi:hypothetical protein